MVGLTRHWFSTLFQKSLVHVVKVVIRLEQIDAVDNSVVTPKSHENVVERIVQVRGSRGEQRFVQLEQFRELCVFFPVFCGDLDIAYVDRMLHRAKQLLGQNQRHNVLVEPRPQQPSRLVRHAKHSNLGHIQVKLDVVRDDSIDRAEIRHELVNRVANHGRRGGSHRFSDPVNIRAFLGNFNVVGDFNDFVVNFYNCVAVGIVNDITELNNVRPLQKSLSAHYFCFRKTGCLGVENNEFHELIGS